MAGRLAKLLLAALACTAVPLRACDLCAIAAAANARGEASHGLVGTLSEQYEPRRTLQFDGQEFSVANPDYVVNSMTHVVASYNFSSRFGLSLNLPIVHREFKRTELHYNADLTSQLIVEQGHEAGIGDLALVARATIFQRMQPDYSILLNLLGGVKFPTGDPERLHDAVEQVLRYEAIVGPGHDHDALGTPISGVHQHDLTLGSGSYDGVFGMTIYTRWKRALFNAQFQYYLRTPGEAGYEFGDEIMINGGPGALVLLRDNATVTLQFNAAFETMARDRILGRESNHTGMTIWYLGPLITVTLGERFSFNAGVDVPVSIDNNGFQNVPDYRAHGGFTLRF